MLFTARDGATISGHVWATVAGPAKRPGIVITNGSVQADEQHVLVRGAGARQGRLRRAHLRPPGPGAVRHLRRSRPTRTRASRPRRRAPVLRRHRGRDRLPALDARSTLRAGAELHHRHQPRRQAEPARGAPGSTPPTTRSGSCSIPSEIGLAGHSYGAAGVSYIGQWDPRVKAIVAWDNLGGPGPTTRRSRVPAPGAPSQTIGEPRCPADPADRTTVPITKPGARHVGRLRAAADAQHLAARPERASRPESLDLLEGRRRHRRDHHPRRLAPGLQLHPQPGVRRLAARRRHDRLVHDRLVRQVPQARRRPPTRGCSPSAGATTRSRRRSTPTTTATRSRSTTARAWTSTWRAGRRSTARTCATAAPGMVPESTTATRGRTPIWPSTRAPMR